VLNSDFLGNPFVILHEFYHHLRSKSVDRQHRGTEKNANRFAADFLIAYQLAGGNVNR
jgi:Zn-dependent peptidase ImmA (M78 family)